MNRKPHTLPTNQINGHHPLLAPAIMLNGHGACQPPRNIVIASAETVVMVTYSASMNIANFNDEYSVWNPPTSSPSASGRSNGARLVSPTIEVPEIRNDGSRKNTSQTRFWAATMPDVDIVPA